MTGAQIIPGGKFGINWQESVSPNGYNLAEVRSAVIKELRRGNDEWALYWALEMFESGREVAHELWNDLRVFSLEDIGPADPQALGVVTSAMSLHMDLPHNDKRVRLSVAAVICFLAHSKKSRYATEILGSVSASREEGVRREIPDCALDLHVLRGRNMGRGMVHYLTEGAHLENEDQRFSTCYREEMLNRARAKEKKGAGS